MRAPLERRTVLAVAGGLALGGVAGAATTGSAVAAPSEESFTVLAGTEHETAGYVRTATADGPTVVVVGGVHGNEVAGYEAAARLSDAAIERGRLVTVPRANVAAIEDGARTAEDGVDLNRQFPVGEEPTTELARALWDAVTRYDPDVFVDLHESKGVYDGDVVTGVGQTIFHSRDDAALADAREAAAYLNENYVTDSTYDFGTDPLDPTADGLSGLFAYKMARDTDAVSFLVETVFDGPELATRIQWHTQIVRRLAAEELFAEGDADANGDGGANGE